HLVVAALIATVAFAAAITVPGGYKGEKELEQGTPSLIHEIAFKAFVVTNALAFIFSICALAIHFRVNDLLLSRVPFWITDIALYRTQSASNLLSHAITATVIAFSTGSYVKEVEKLLKGVAHEKVAELQVSCIPLPTISAESLEKTRDAHLVVVALIATVAFLTGITVPGGLNSEKGLEQGTPYLIDEATIKSFV
ncbi:hypothetical protein Gotur_032803, partial [Gossypium turneri]